MMQKCDFKAIKAGDRVWIGRDETSADKHLTTVARITPTQIIVDWHGTGSYFRKYTRDRGLPIPKSYAAWRVLRLATISECVEWEAAQRAAKKAAQRKLEAEEQAKGKRQALQDLFTVDVSVGHEVNGKRSVEFFDLTDEQVRELARKVKEA
jgi:hypothetical protein